MSEALWLEYKIHYRSSIRKLYYIVTFYSNRKLLYNILFIYQRIRIANIAHLEFSNDAVISRAIQNSVIQDFGFVYMRLLCFALLFIESETV